MKTLFFILINPDVHIKDVRKNSPAILDAGDLSRIDHFADGPNRPPQVLTRFWDAVEPLN
jgi:hypothetical protein